MAEIVIDGSILHRFLKYLPDEMPESECWKWQGSKHKTGYGQLSHKKQRTVHKAHRLAYVIAKGDIPDGMMICHTCDNPACVNPSHLYAGTAKDNFKDMIERDRHVPPPHVPGSKCGMALLDEEKVRYIRSSDKTPEELAEKFNVKPRTIRAVISRQNWRHVE